MFKNFLMRWLGVKPMVLRARRVSDEKILDTLAVPEEHAWLQVVLELLDRQRAVCRDEAKGAEGNADRARFYLGGENALDAFEAYLLNTRASALQAAAERDRISRMVAQKRAATGATAG
jgi:hypothetical protein